MEGYCSTGESPQRAVVPVEEEEEEEEEEEFFESFCLFNFQPFYYTFIRLKNFNVI
jgi:hypothetical protein